MGFPVIIQLIANLYKEQESVVRTTNGDTEWFKIERGVRQGCVISPGLYNIYSEHIMRCVLEEHHDGITIGGRRQNNLRFADDTTMYKQGGVAGPAQKGQRSQQVTKPIVKHTKNKDHGVR